VGEEIFDDDVPVRRGGVRASRIVGGVTLVVALAVGVALGMANWVASPILAGSDTGADVSVPDVAPSPDVATQAVSHDVAAVDSAPGALQLDANAEHDIVVEAEVQEKPHVHPPRRKRTKRGRTAARKPRVVASKEVKKPTDPPEESPKGTAPPRTLDSSPKPVDGEGVPPKTIE
jgi:hypothetical protein